jgi:putative ABC transport system substrate-binding protein
VIVRVVALALLLLAAQPAAAQPAKTPVIGILTPQTINEHVRAFVDKLAALGYEDGRTARLVVRYAEAKPDRLPALAAELVRAKPDVILAINTPGTRAALAATKEIPIVMVAVGDPVGSGFVKALAVPGGNVTGVTNLAAELAPKRLQVFKEALPSARKIAVLYNPTDPVVKPQLPEIERAARAFAVEVRLFAVRDPAALAQAEKDLVAWRAEAGMWLAGQHQSFAKATIELAIRRQVPFMSVDATEVEAGGLLSYYPDLSEHYRRAAEYVDRILKGARPADLPVEQPTKIDLVVNRKTARALGLTLPPSLLLRADRVID